MSLIASQITSLTIVYSIVNSDTNQRKHQSSASLAFVRGIHRRPVNCPHKGPVTREMIPFDDVIMNIQYFIFPDYQVGQYMPLFVGRNSRVYMRNFPFQMAEPRFQVVVIGDSGVGKTSMLVTYWSGKFPTVYIPTSFETVAFYRMVDGQAMIMDICDTAGGVNWYRLTFRWISTRLQYLHCISNGDTAVLH